MPPTYTIVCRAIDGVWHAQVVELDHLSARGDNPIGLMLDLALLIEQRLGHKDFQTALVIEGMTKGKDAEQVRLASMAPSTDHASVRRLIDKHSLSRHADRILADLRPAVLIKTRRLAPNDPPRRGRSRFGGDPDLPAGTPWPTTGGRPLTLLAQLRLSELPAMPAADAAAFNMPAAGFLWFWYDEAGGPWSSAYGQDDGPFRVTFEPDASARLVRAPAPPGVHRHHPCTLSLRRVVSLPQLEECGETYDAEDLDRYFELEAEVQAESGRDTHQLRGHHNALYTDHDDLRPDDAELLLELSWDPPGPGWG